MRRTPARRRVVALGAIAVAGTLATTMPVAAEAAVDRTDLAAPTSSEQPYLKPRAIGVSIKSHLTVADLAAKDGYEMVGVPDGLGAYANKSNRAVVLMNHELDTDEGVVRRHGQQGSFISRLVIDQQTGSVVNGRDLIGDRVRYWDYQSRRYSETPVAPTGAQYGHEKAFARFCSASLTEPGQLLNEATQRGAHRQLFFANEEAGDEGRVFAVRRNGTTTQLPRLGLFSWENTLAAPNTTDTTVVMGNEDGSDGQLRVYVGRKRPAGFPERQAGLTNGDLFVVDAANEGVSTDAGFRATFGTGRPARVQFSAGEQIDTTRNGALQNAEAAAKGLQLNRIEDGAFDPGDKNDYYFTTTEGGSTTPNPKTPAVPRNGGGLWRLSFDDVERPELGGTLTLLLDGSERPYLNKPDNLSIDDEHNLLIQEDPGGNDQLARIVAYHTESGRRGVVARFDPALFGVSNPSGTTPDERARLTTDEESSGIISTDHLFGDDSYLFDAQVHTEKGLPRGRVEELVQRGQLLSMVVENWRAVYDIG